MARRLGRIENKPLGRQDFEVIRLEKVIERNISSCLRSADRSELQKKTIVHWWSRFCDLLAHKSRRLNAQMQVQRYACAVHQRFIVCRWSHIGDCLARERWKQIALMQSKRDQETEEFRSAALRLRDRRVMGIEEKSRNKHLENSIRLRSHPRGELIEITTLVQASTFRDLHFEAQGALGIPRRASPISLRLTLFSRMSSKLKDAPLKVGEVIPCNDASCMSLRGCILTARQS